MEKKVVLFLVWIIKCSGQLIFLRHFCFSVRLSHFSMVDCSISQYLLLLLWWFGKLFVCRSYSHLAWNLWKRNRMKKKWRGLQHFLLSFFFILFYLFIFHMKHFPVGPSIYSWRMLLICRSINCCNFTPKQGCASGRTKIYWFQHMKM